MELEHMREFWDERAQEDAYFFVDVRRTYRDRELSEFWVEGERDLDLFLRLLDVELAPSDIVLDIGCGVGRLTRVIAGRASRVYGIDVSSEMLARARRHHAGLENIDWILGDGYTLRPVADASVDACISHVVFHHIPDPRITLGYVREMGRVLRPGGWAAFQISNDVRVHRRRRDVRAFWWRVGSTFGRLPRGRDDPAWRGSAVQLDDLRSAATSAALHVERVVGEGTELCFVLARRTAEPS